MDEVEAVKEYEKVRISDLKFYIYVATTAAGLFFYLSSTFATVTSVKSLEKEVVGNKEVLCKIAIAVKANVAESCARYR